MGGPPMSGHCVLDPGKGVGEQVPVGEGSKGGPKDHGAGGLLVISGHITAGRKTYGHVSDRRHLKTGEMSRRASRSLRSREGALPAEKVNLSVSSGVNRSYEADGRGL